jgi:hypothetical protein
MPRTCVFCGGSPTTNEHIWPDWARPILAEEGALDHHRLVQQDDHPDEAYSWKQPAYIMTTKVVCARCNNGCMSDLENRAKPLLGPMLFGRGRALHREGQRTLAAWALKTAMMVEHTHGAKRQMIDRAEHEHLMAVGEPSERIRVWLTSYVGDVVAMAQTYGLDAHMELSPDPDRGRRDMWGATITFGAGVLQVFGTTLTALLDGVEVNGQGVHQIWPYERSITWTPRPGFDNAGLLAFADGLLNRLRRLPAPVSRALTGSRAPRS